MSPSFYKTAVKFICINKGNFKDIPTKGLWEVASWHETLWVIPKE